MSPTETHRGTQNQTNQASIGTPPSTAHRLHAACLRGLHARAVIHPFPPPKKKKKKKIRFGHIPKDDVYWVE